MTIDPEKLEEGLKLWEDVSCDARFKAVVEAARAHLASLPRYKEVEAEAWVVVDAQGRVGAFLYHNDADARDAANERGHGAQAVRLTGTAKVRVTP